MRSDIGVPLDRQRDPAAKWKHVATALKDMGDAIYTLEQLVREIVELESASTRVDSEEPHGTPT